ncbi:unnamed protein product [Oppiella nova]|uniref:Caspase n=1 Tax=Oppiella nova TaxID=334625 RepID=A0A7R9QEI3_9ACAR|nr:unnamed protein product [Oppiella nova]CAG2164297.1 unnamed protein product [Oppiella nova]
MTRLRDLVFTGREFTSKLTVRKARKIMSNKHQDVYPMRRRVRGFCIIINNQMFADPMLKFRSGSRADAYRLSDVFSQLGFDVHMFANQTSGQMMELLIGFLDRKADLSAHDALAVIILSHGCKDGVYGSDGQVVYVGNILLHFNNKTCATLIGKPKMLFVTACRGDEMDQGVELLNRPSFGITRGYSSPRNTITGSWFGYGVAHCLAQYSATEHLNDLMTIRVAQYVDHRISQIPGVGAFKSAIECKTLGFVKKRNRMEIENELLVIIANMESMDWKDIKKFGHTIETSGLLTHELCEHYSTTQWMTRLNDLVFTGREFASKLTVRKARKIKSTKRGDVYPMHRKVFADPELTFRSGSRADAHRLSDVFSQLGFDVHMYDNQTSDQMTELLMGFRDKREDLSAHDALAIIILSHGCEDGVYGTDGQRR